MSFEPRGIYAAYLGMTGWLAGGMPGFCGRKGRLGWLIVYRRETKVMYAVSNSNHNVGTFTLLVNADGTPMLWRDNEKER